MWGDRNALKLDGGGGCITTDLLKTVELFTYNE